MIWESVLEDIKIILEKKMSVKCEIVKIFLFLLFSDFCAAKNTELTDGDEIMITTIRCFWHVMCNLSKLILFFVLFLHTN